MRRLSVLAIALGTALVAPILGQSQAVPDMSGRWVLNIAKSKLAKSAKISSETLLITSSASNVTMRFNTDGKESIQAYATDGKEHVTAEFQGGQNLVKAYWRKSSLIIETFGRLKMPDTPSVDGYEPFRLKERWTLAAGGRVLTCEGEGFQKTVSVYDKQ